MTLTERLTLGCARLTGGASAAEAEALVRAAFDAGIRHVDTAPSYGMGTAEVVIGKAIKQFGGSILVTAKLGSARDRHAIAKSWLRRAKRILSSESSTLWEHSDPPLARVSTPCGHDFTNSAMRASLELSSQRLGRIDYLLLHDVSAGEVTDRLLADLNALAAGVSAVPGYASQAQWNFDLDRRFPQDMVRQCAVSVSGAGANTGPLFLHSIVKAGAARRASSPDFATKLETAARVVGTGDIDADRIAALYVAAGAAAPHARLIIASSHSHRLQAVLRAIARVDSAGSATEIAAWLAS